MRSLFLNFIKNITVFEEIKTVFRWSEIQSIDYKQINTNGICFPELIFPQVIKFYKEYNRIVSELNTEGKNDENEDDEILKYYIFEEMNAFFYFFYFNGSIESSADEERILETFFEYYFKFYLSTIEENKENFSKFKVKFMN